MSGSNRLEDLHPSVRSWWEPWAVDCAYYEKAGVKPKLEVSSNYSKQFREFYGKQGEVDQISLLINGIREHPFSRRNVITTWNTADMVSPDTPITNCHGTVIQAFCNEQEELSLVTYQRSVDVVCGLPHNWFQYWAFLLWLSSRTGKKVGQLIWLGGDCHLYGEHSSLAEEIVACETSCPPPNLVYSSSCEDFKADDFSLDGEYSYSIDKKARMVV